MGGSSQNESDKREGVEIISQHSVQIGGVSVNFTVGRIKPKEPKPASPINQGDQL